MNRTYWVTREVIEHIEIVAKDDYAADEIANESPVDQWTREIKTFTVEDVTSPASP